MTLTKVSHSNFSAGHVGSNQRATEDWSGEINGKSFSVHIDSTTAPVWSGEELDSDEQAEVLNAMDGD